MSGLIRKHPRVLIIDDDDHFRRTLRLMIEKIGFEVVEAADGEAGLDLIAQEPIDLVMTDIIMPRMEGLEAIIEIRHKFPTTKIIAMSGGGCYGTEIDFDMANKLGAVTLQKPFNFEELLNKVNLVVKNPRAPSRFLKLPF